MALARIRRFRSAHVVPREAADEREDRTQDSRGRRTSEGGSQEEAS